MWKVKLLDFQSCPALCDPMDCSLPGSSVHGNYPGKNTDVGYHSLLQGIFPTQRLNLSLPHCRQILCHLSHQVDSRYIEVNMCMCVCVCVCVFKLGGTKRHWGKLLILSFLLWDPGFSHQLASRNDLNLHSGKVKIQILESRKEGRAWGFHSEP